MSVLVNTDVPLAVTVIVSVVALASIAAVILLMRRTTRLSGITVAVSVGSAIGIVVVALLVGGSLTQPPAAVADAPPARATVDLVDPAVRIELPTLELDG